MGGNLGPEFTSRVTSRVLLRFRRGCGLRQHTHANGLAVAQKRGPRAHSHAGG